MITEMLLMSQYNAAVIPIGSVVRDYFPHISLNKFLRKVSAGEIKIPLYRAEGGTQKTAKGIHVTDLAQYIDTRRAAAVKESAQLASGG